MHEPELLVPVSERPAPVSGGWRLSLKRLWCVLAIVCAWVVFVSGERELHWKAAIYTLAGFYFAMELAAWIAGPLLSRNRQER